MSFRLKIKHFLIHRLNYTNKAAAELISSGKLTVNGKVILTNEVLLESDELRLNNEEVLKPKADFSYYALYKPVGIESTFDDKRSDNLSKVFPFDKRFFVAGRLDKASEGLLLISDDGKWVNAITHEDNYKEKEYLVQVNKVMTPSFISLITSGVKIGNYITRPCKAKALNEFTFNIILTEGKNRQIRKMCKTLGYEVTNLKRIRIDKFYLSDLEELEYVKLNLT